MSLLKSTGTIAGLTLVSRVLGFARDIILARVLGAGMAGDAFQLAFRLPNTFRRLFAEGAFSVAYVPMFSRVLHGEGGHEGAQRFSQDVLSVFVPVLLLFTAVFEIIMPGFIWLLAEGYRGDPEKLALATQLSRIAFPYLFFISLVSLLTGILNSMSRFSAGASAPILFNMTLVTGALLGGWLRGDSGNSVIVAQTMAAAVAISGVVQLIWLWYWVKKSGFTLKIRRPRLTPDVRELGRIIVPATFGAGIYQVSQFIDTFFATQLPLGSLTHLAMADRLNQMPLGVIGIALGTAILPALSRRIVADDGKGANALQSEAIELAMLLTLPAAAALFLCAQAFVGAFFVGGAFTAEDGRITANVLSGIVCGLPAYVLVKVLTPGFFARKDTRTPVWTAAASLTVNVLLILAMIGPFGIVGLVAAGAGAAWFNTFLLYAILHKRGHYRAGGLLIARLAKMLLATALMSATLWWLTDALGPMIRSHATILKLAGLTLLVGTGMAVYFGSAFLLHAFDREQFKALIKRKRRTA